MRRRAHPASQPLRARRQPLYLRLHSPDFAACDGRAQIARARERACDKVALMMVREKTQIFVLLLAIAALLFAISRIYTTQLAMTPHNLEGNIATEGGSTANAPN